MLFISLQKRNTAFNGNGCSILPGKTFQWDYTLMSLSWIGWLVIGNWSLVDWWIDQLILCRSTFYIDICFIVLDTRNNFMVLRCFWTPDKFASFVATNLHLLWQQIYFFFGNKKFLDSSNHYWWRCPGRRGGVIHQTIQNWRLSSFRGSLVL